MARKHLVILTEKMNKKLHRIKYEKRMKNLNEVFVFLIDEFKGMEEVNENENLQ